MLNKGFNYVNFNLKYLNNTSNSKWLKNSQNDDVLQLIHNQTSYIDCKIFINNTQTILSDYMVNDNIINIIFPSNLKLSTTDVIFVYIIQIPIIKPLGFQCNVSKILSNQYYWDNINNNIVYIKHNLNTEKINCIMRLNNNNKLIMPFVYFNPIDKNTIKVYISDIITFNSLTIKLNQTNFINTIIYNVNNEI